MSPFPMWPAFPSLEYYGGSVTLGLASLTLITILAFSISSEHKEGIQFKSLFCERSISPTIESVHNRDR